MSNKQTVDRHFELVGQADAGKYAFHLTHRYSAKFKMRNQPNLSFVVTAPTKASLWKKAAELANLVKDDFKWSKQIWAQSLSEVRTRGSTQLDQVRALRQAANWLDMPNAATIVKHLWPKEA